MNRYFLGKKSIATLVGVHPYLIKTVKRAIEITAQDFSVYDGVRTVAEQKEMVRRGVSKTMHSKHLKQTDGFSHAVDLVPFIDGNLKWDWDGCYKIALAMDLAATELGYARMIVWGGSWDRRLSDYGNDPSDYKAEVEAYCRRHPGPDFIDGPHFELRI